MWSRQLLGASGAALLVPAAMLGALAVLALGGGLSSVGVLGQIFAGPPAPELGGVPGGQANGAGGASAATVPARALAALVPPPAGPGRASSAPPQRGGGGVSARPVPSAAPRGTGSAGTAPIAIRIPVSSTPRPAPVGPAPAAPSRPVGTQPSPQPPPQPPPPPPTVVDQVVTVVTQVSSQLPSPFGPAATGLVQSAGSAASRLVPPTGSPLP